MYKKLVVYFYLRRGVLVCKYSPVWFSGGHEILQKSGKWADGNKVLSAAKLGWRVSSVQSCFVQTIYLEQDRTRTYIRKLLISRMRQSHGEHFAARLAAADFQIFRFSGFGVARFPGYRDIRISGFKIFRFSAIHFFLYLWPTDSRLATPYKLHVHLLLNSSQLNSTQLLGMPWRTPPRKLTLSIMFPPSFRFPKLTPL